MSKHLTLLAEVDNLPEIYRHCGFSTFNETKSNRNVLINCKGFSTKINYIFTGKSFTGNYGKFLLMERFSEKPL